MCEAGEKIMEKEKGLYPNLDYYAAPVYWMLGIPIHFTHQSSLVLEQ